MHDMFGSRQPRLPADDGRVFWFLGTLVRLKASAEETAGTFGLIEQSLPPGFAAPPHIHHAEDEAFYILEGDFAFFCADRELHAKTGSFIWLPRDLRHWFRVEGQTPGRLLQWNLPAGLERFFVEMGEAVSDPEKPPAAPPDLAKLLNLARQYRVEIELPNSAE